MPRKKSQEVAETTQVPETALTVVEGQLPDVQLQREYKKRCNIIRKQVSNIQHSFLTIAFQLHWIREHNMFKLEGCKNIYDYAEREYGIGRTSCCNLVCIVEHFASRDENGNVIESLDKCYENYTASQFVAMIGMTDEGKKRITPDMSVRAINRLRKEEQIKALPEAPIATTEATISGSEGEANTTVTATVHASDSKTIAEHTTAEAQPEHPKQVDTLMAFDSYTSYQKELERIDALIKRAFKRAKQPAVVKIICEQV